MSSELNNKSVVNLSHFKLEESHISLLSRGLKFCPTPANPNIGQLQEDLDRLHKRLRQIAFFENPEFNLTSENQGTPPTPTPSEGNNLRSLTEFKHRKFKNPAKGKGPPGATNLGP